MNAKVMRLLLVATLLNTGCQRPMGAGQLGGGIIGAGVGGLLGSQIGGGSGRIVAGVIGAGLGALIGSHLGQQLDEEDKGLCVQATQQAMDTGQPVRWENPQTRHYGEVRPIRVITPDPYDPRTSRFVRIREYKHLVYIDGRAEEVRGRAGQDRSGQWHNIS